MTEEKDDFLREIDELLQGDLDVEAEVPLSNKSEAASVENVSNGVANLDLNAVDGELNLQTSTPSKQLDSNHVSDQPQEKYSPPPPPKTGYKMHDNIHFVRAEFIIP